MSAGQIWEDTLWLFAPDSSQREGSVYKHHNYEWHHNLKEVLKDTQFTTLTENVWAGGKESSHSVANGRNYRNVLTQMTAERLSFLPRWHVVTHIVGHMVMQGWKKTSLWRLIFFCTYCSQKSGGKICRNIKGNLLPDGFCDIKHCMICELYL